MVMTTVVMMIIIVIIIIIIVIEIMSSPDDKEIHKVEECQDLKQEVERLLEVRKVLDCCGGCAWLHHKKNWING